MRNTRHLLVPFAALLALGLAGCEDPAVEQDQAALEENGSQESETDLAATDTEGMATTGSESRDAATRVADTSGMQGGSPAGEQIQAVAVEESEQYGQYLVASDGRAVYLYFEDSQGRSNCTGECAEIWPPVLAESGEPQVDDPSIDQSKLGTIQREDGSTQVTYDGHPLYFYAQDSGPGEATGQGVNNEWALITVEGEAVQSRARGSARY